MLGNFFIIPHNNECTYKFELNSNLKKNKNIKGLVPQNKRLPYDVKKIIYEICDEGSFIEIQEQYAPNIIVGMGKVNNGTVGIIANQPMIKAGVLDADSSVKAARFIRYCDCYNIPIITLVDTPGFMPSENEEKKGIIRHGAKLVTAYAEAHIKAIILHRISHYLYLNKFNILARIISEESHSMTGIDIHPGAKIGKNLFIDHGTGIVIGETTIIGNNVTIYQGVTLGTYSFRKNISDCVDFKTKRHPTIEDNVTIYANATILGGNTIVGKNSIIGSNAWVAKSVEANSLVKANCIIGAH